MILKELISESEYAVARGVSVRSIQRERALRQGPPFIKLGKSIFYRPAAIEAWLLKQEQTPASGRLD